MVVRVEKWVNGQICQLKENEFGEMGWGRG